MKISVVVRARNEEKTIQSCLDSILHQRGVSMGDLELIVVDNASTDNTRTIIEQFAMRHADTIRTRTIDEPVISPGKALDTAFRAANHDWVASLDGDSEAESAWLQNVLAHIRTHPDDVAASGHLEFRQGPSYHRFLYRTLRDFLFGYFSGHGLGFLSGANFWMQRDAFMRVGGTAHFKGKHDDKYLAMHLRDMIRASGGRYRIGYCPTALVWTENWILESRTGHLKELQWMAGFVRELREIRVVPELVRVVKTDLQKRTLLGGPRWKQ